MANTTVLYDKRTQNWALTSVKECVNRFRRNVTDDHVYRRHRICAVSPRLMKVHLIYKGRWLLDQIGYVANFGNE
jgi:hypothetical protein